MSRTDVQIRTPDGEARAFAFTPSQGRGPWPAVIMFMDALAIRPTLFDMAQRLADSGYYVLLPDLFWRVGPYEPIDTAAVFRDEEGRKALFAKFGPAMDQTALNRDTGAYLEWLAGQPQVKGRKVGTTGYCFGGGLSLRAAGTYSGRVAAAAAFHPGNLATDAPDSPHLLAPAMTAKIYVGGADNDPGFDAAQRDRLAKALDDAGVDGLVELYEGALHGFAPSDTPVYDKAASERHWRETITLFNSTLK